MVAAYHRKVRDLLRSAWTEPRPADPPRRTGRDWALLGVVVLLVIVEGLLRPDLPARTVSVIIALALAPVLLWRRTHPLLVVALAFTTVGLTPLFIGHELDLMAGGYVLILPYTLFRWGSGREAMAGAALILAKICLSAAFDYLSFSDAVLGFVVMFAAFALAIAMRYRARLRVRELDQAKLLERERIARDLHDIVAHHVSAMAIRAQAGIAVAPTRPDAAIEALRLIEAEATRALAEMRTMVRGLRQPADLTPSPGIAEVEQLASRSPAGPVVDVELLGDLDDIPPTVGTAIYRLAQESVTNARRHARHATRIEVRVAADPRSVCLRVSDDGDTRPHQSTAPGGFGLGGMKERVDLLGGTYEAGPNPDRGWTVTAALPRT